MKEPSPLVPQGSFEAQAQRKSHVRIAVFSILAIHVVVLGGLLILGCKRDEKVEEVASTPPPMTNDIPPFPGTSDLANVTNPIVESNPPPLVNVPPVVTNPLPLTPVPPTPTPVNPDVAPLIEHTIVRGDSFATLATKYGVSARSIQDANPTLVPTRLKLGEKVKIPPKSASIRPTASPTATGGESDVYVVKSGDTLSKIAKSHRTTVSELQKLNGLTTTQIRVSQRLKLPPHSAAAPAGGATPPPAQ